MPLKLDRVQGAIATSRKVAKRAIALASRERPAPQVTIAKGAIQVRVINKSQKSGKQRMTTPEGYVYVIEPVED